MGDLVNLRQARKQRARDEKERLAAENRKRFGRGKLERTREAAEHRRKEAVLDGARIDRPEKPGA
ncbi:DUF4169 family protein [Jiella avicenniae]|uniref:DUF4169 family protein n=1 Tax=Jiella avicenniae TaxID=2907202 RepID=A0A9X1T416_9HYPH|nr:DUF4169 family protein [Jiella avicenniae]MCE7027432.1 DUF4169 family protein [Jiella avicenniae]